MEPSHLDKSFMQHCLDYLFWWKRNTWSHSQVNN